MTSFIQKNKLNCFSEVDEYMNNIFIKCEKVFPVNKKQSNTVFIKNSSIATRDKVLKLAHKNKIFLRPVWKPLHTFKHFKEMPRMNLDAAIKIYVSCINLPSSASYFDSRK